MSKTRAVLSAAKAGKLVTIRYSKKTTGETVIRDVGVMSDAGGFLYCQHEGQVKKFIKSRILEAERQDEDFVPSGGYESAYSLNIPEE